MLASRAKLTLLVLLHAGGLANAADDMCKREHAVSCAGGGFRAYSTCAGLLSGFLTATEEGSLDELFEDVDVVSGISGGSWWLSGLMYSGEMPAMHEAMAKMPSDAADIFNTAWSQKTAPPAASRRLDVEEHIDPMHTFFCPALGARGSTAQWERYVQAPTSLPGDATLSTKPNRSFAEGKLFAVLASVPQPGSVGRWENEKVWVHVTFNGFDFSVPTTPKAVGPYASMYYSAKSPQDEPLPLWAPTKWSFVIGDSEDAKSPLPFCGEEDCHDVFLEYTGYTENATFSYYSPPISEIFKRFEEMAGSTPLDTLMDTSSAALASTVLEPEANGLPATNLFVQDLGAAVYNQWACRLQASWIDREGHGYPSDLNFQGFPLTEITPELVNMTAHSGLQGVNDGAWTDNTGVTAALAALTSATGCDDERRLSVTAMLNGEEAEAVTQYFGFGDVPPPLRFAGFPSLFNGSNKPHGYVCGSPSYEEVLQEMTNRSNAVPLPMPPVNVSARLHGIYYGTFKCMTVENEWYGVKGGFMVDINWIWAESGEPASPEGGWSFENVARFGELAGEIVQAMVEEDETTKDVAAMFFPKPEEELCDTSSWVEMANATVCGPCKASVPFPPDRPGVTCELFCAQVAGATCTGAYQIDPNGMDLCAPLAPIGCNETIPGEDAFICECQPDLCRTHTWPELFSEYLEENPPYLAEYPFRSTESYQVIPCGSCKALHSVPRDGMTCAGFCSEVLHAECKAGYIPDLFANSNPCQDFKYEVGCDASSQGEVITQGQVTTTIFPMLVCECGIPGTMDMCEEEEWDDAAVCEDCKVQTSPAVNCWSYCLFQANTGCKGAYYPIDNETCAAFDEASCFTPAFGDDLICECEAPVPPLDFCYSYTWPAMGMMFPDLSVEVCDEACTVQASRPEPDDNCESYCNQVIDATCEGSWLPMMGGEACEKGEMIGCDEIREGVPAYICECGAPGSYAPPPPSDMCKREHALTCAGGGFRAYSTCAGMLSGLLTVTPEGSLDELFAGIDVVAGISGGSWWLSGLMYSGEMPAMHEAMAKNTSNASEIFNTAWSQKTAPIAARRLSAEEHIDPFPSFFCPALGARGSTLQWERYVQAPTSLPGDATLSTKPNRSFAEGKLFAVLASVPQPGSEGRWENEKVWVHVTSSGFDFSDPNLPKAVGPFASMYYSAKSGQDEPLPLWAPTKWSFVIGEGEDAKSPLPFCGEEDCHHVFLEYTGYTENATFSAYSAPISEIFKRFEEMAGATPLNTLMDTSSAALASTVLEPEENGLPAAGVFTSFDVGAAVFNQALCEAQASWIDKDGHGYPDDLHASPVTPELVNRTAYSGLQGVNDGAWTDNTGVTAALAALTSAMGCDDDRELSVTALLNGEDFDNAIPYFGFGDVPPALPYAGLPNLFNGSNKPHGYVCGSPSYEEVLQEMASRSNAVPLPVNASTRLHGLYYGTFKCMTVDNEWYGVKGGFMVDINWLWAESAEPASPEGGWSFENVARFGELAGEIVGAMVYSDDVTRGAASELFPRGSFPDPCNTSSWPMLYPSLTVCGSCEAHVQGPPGAAPGEVTCETFCNQAINATCEGSWLPMMFGTETCQKGEMIGCGEYRAGVEELICECGAPGSYVPPEECKREHALTCAGGGFRAYSTCAGLLSGFLTATPEGSLDELFEGVDVVSAISGGSWWLSGLMYSGEMPAMHEAMAKMPSDAGEIFNTAWSQKTAPIATAARRLDVEEHIDPFPSFFCPALGQRGSTLQWERYVQAPTSLPGDATLSMKPNRSFAEGKLFAVLASVPQPGSGRWETEKVWVHVTAGGFDFSTPNLPKATGPYTSMYYSAKSGKDEPLPLWAPAKWSFVIGDDYDDPSPLPFCGQEDCQEVFLEYTGYTENATFSAYSPPLSEIFKRFEEMAGATPLNTLMDTSSAALASTVLEPEANGLPAANVFTQFDVGAAVFNQLACIPQASWMDREGHGYPSTLQASAITPELVNSTAYSGLQGVNDGAWTDNTGVTAALAALTSVTGCYDDRSLSVTALLNGEEFDNAIPYFGIGDFPPPLPYAGLPNLFNGSNKPHGYVCGSPSYDEVLQVMANRSNYVPLPTPPVNASARLHGLYYGSFKCMTVDNEWYGVKGGFMVDINWIWAESAEPASPEGGWSFESVARFGELAGEIVDAMVYSDEATRAAGRALFPRGSFEDVCETSSWPMYYPNLTVCGTCEAYVQIPPHVDMSDGTCESFCNEVLDAACEGAWLPAAMGMEETCERGMMLGCDEFNMAAGAYICECGPRGSFDSCMTDEWEGALPEIGVCAHCQVAVPDLGEYGSCWNYCSTVNRTCESALISKGFPDVCAVEESMSCFYPLTDDIALCQCSEEQTYDPCDTYNWPDWKDICEFCRPVIGDFYQEYGTCENYCHGLGRSCQGAWAQAGYDYMCDMGMPYECDAMIEAESAICECSLEPLFERVPQLLFRSSGFAGAYDNMWPGWSMRGYLGTTTDGKSMLTYGKQPAYDEMCLHGLTFRDANGTFATYTLTQEYYGMTLLEIVKKCMPMGNETMNTGMGPWEDGHCDDVGYLMDYNMPDYFHPKLRLFVGHGMMEDNWAIFMPIWPKGGDFQEYDTWAFASKGETCTGFQNMVYIEGFATYKCYEMEEGDDDDSGDGQLLFP